MKKAYYIGVDVGGTNTDFVLYSRKDDGSLVLIKSHKQPSCDSAVKSITAGIETLVANIDQSQVQTIQMGTTLLLNTLINNKAEAAAVLRLGGEALPPGIGWEKADLAKKSIALSQVSPGGFHFHGGVIAKLNMADIVAFAKEAKDKKINNIVICGVFSKINPKQELLARDIVKIHHEDAHITLSHEQEGDLIERENATILNAILRSKLQQVTLNLESDLAKLGLVNVQVLISKNDGTVSPINQVTPVETFRAASRNSIAGAAQLCQSKKGISIVVDIGGTSADGGLIENGKPIKQSLLVKEEGISLTIPTVRVHSIGLGGGTQVTITSDGTIKLGESITKEPTKKALSFGGKTLTLTDIAIAMGRIKPKNANLQAVTALYSQAVIQKIDEAMHQKLATFVRDIRATVVGKISALVLVGGGSYLFDLPKLNQALKLTLDRPTHANVANAIGAATAILSAMHTEIIDLSQTTSEDAIAYIKAIARKKLLAKGAKSSSIKPSRTIKTTLQYLPGTTKITVELTGTRDTHFSASEKQESKQKNQPKTVVKITEKDIKLLLDKSAAPIQRATAGPRSESKQLNSPAYKKLNPIYQALSVEIKEENLNLRAKGCEIISSGGGGSTNITKKIATALLKKGAKIYEIPLDKLPNNARVFCFGVVGSPDVLSESPPSIQTMCQSIRAYEKKLGYTFDAIVPAEIGGANGLIAYAAGAALGIPVVGADCMGRAFPGVNMTTPVVHDAIKNFTAALSSQGDNYALLEAKSAVELEAMVYAEITKLGAVSMISYMPMNGKTAKSVCVPNSPLLTENLGKAFMQAKALEKSPIIAINRFLTESKSQYGQMRRLTTGRVVKQQKINTGRFSIGALTIEDEQGRIFEVLFQNESIFCRQVLANGEYLSLAKVPEIITVINSHTNNPIGTQDFEHIHGIKVSIYAMNVPAMLRTPKAMTVFGPESPVYQLNERTKLFDPKKKEAKSKEHTGNTAALFKAPDKDHAASAPPATAEPNP